MFAKRGELETNWITFLKWFPLSKEVPISLWRLYFVLVLVGFGTWARLGISYSILFFRLVFMRPCQEPIFSPVSALFKHISMSQINRAYKMALQTPERNWIIELEPPPFTGSMEHACYLPKKMMRWISRCRWPMINVPIWNHRPKRDAIWRNVHNGTLEFGLR